MINLLPPDIKKQMRYAKYNRTALAYLQLTVIVLVVLALIFVGTIFYVNLQTTQVAKNVQARQADLASTVELQKQLQDASDRLTAIKTLETSQTRFSVLLSDLAKYLPQGVSLEGITLTGDDKKPLSIAVVGTSYDSILAFRNAILLSPRIAGADLVSITSSATGFQGNVVIAFKPGQAK
jgi:Tfp pilus assembly protein PilN